MTTSLIRRAGRPRAAGAGPLAHAGEAHQAWAADVRRREHHHQRQQGEQQHHPQPRVDQPDDRRDDPQGVRARRGLLRGRRAGPLRGGHPPARPRVHHPAVLRRAQPRVHQEVRAEPAQHHQHLQARPGTPRCSSATWSRWPPRCSRTTRGRSAGRPSTSSSRRSWSACRTSAIKQLAQMLIFEFNQLAGARGSQVVFTDFNLYWNVPRHLREAPGDRPGGRIHRQDVLASTSGRRRLFLKALFEVYLEGDAMGKTFVFPKPLLHINEDFFRTEGWEEFLDLACDVASKQGITYFVFDRGDEVTVSQCCRLKLKLEGGGPRRGADAGEDALLGAAEHHHQPAAASPTRRTATTRCSSASSRRPWRWWRRAHLQKKQFIDEPDGPRAGGTGLAAMPGARRRAVPAAGPADLPRRPARA